MLTSTDCWKKHNLLAERLLEYGDLNRFIEENLSNFLMISGDRGKTLQQEENPLLLSSYRRFMKPVSEALRVGYTLSSFRETSSEALLGIFKDCQSYTNPWLMKIVQKLRPASILDIGCGAGNNIISYAIENPNVISFGIDRDVEQIAAAKRSAQRLGCEDRCFFSAGEFLNGTELELPFDPEIVLFSSVLNDLSENFEFASELLSFTGKLFPNSAIAVADFYGTPWRTRSYRPEYEMAYLHDFQSMLCGFNHLTASRSEWQLMFSSSQIPLVHEAVQSSNGYHHFVSIFQA